MSMNVSGNQGPQGMDKMNPFYKEEGTSDEPATRPALFGNHHVQMAPKGNVSWLLRKVYDSIAYFFGKPKPNNTMTRMGEMAAQDGVDHLHEIANARKEAQLSSLSEKIDIENKARLGKEMTTVPKNYSESISSIPGQKMSLSEEQSEAIRNFSVATLAEDIAREALIGHMQDGGKNDSPIGVLATKFKNSREASAIALNKLGLEVQHGEVKDADNNALPSYDLNENEQRAIFSQVQKAVEDSNLKKN